MRTRTRDQEIGSNSEKVQQFTELYLELKDVCELSDRSFYKLRKFAVAYDLLSGRDNSHLRVFRFTAPQASKVDYVHSIVRSHMASAGLGGGI